MVILSPLYQAHGYQVRDEDLCARRKNAQIKLEFLGKIALERKRETNCATITSFSWSALSSNIALDRQLAQSEIIQLERFSYDLEKWLGKARFRCRTFHESNLIRIKADPNYLDRLN